LVKRRNGEFREVQFIYFSTFVHAIDSKKKP